MNAVAIGLLAALLCFVARQGLASSRRQRVSRDAEEFASIGQRDPRPLKGEVPYLQELAVQKKAAARTRERRRMRLAARTTRAGTRKTALPFRKAGVA